MVFIRSFWFDWKNNRVIRLFLLPIRRQPITLLFLIASALKENRRLNRMTAVMTSHIKFERAKIMKVLSVKRC